MLNSSRKNADNACEAFIKIIEEIKGVTYTIVCRPEEKNRNTQDVDFILAPEGENGRSPKIAVEHTIIEAHENQFLYANQFCNIVKEIDRKCQGKLPIDYYFSIEAPPSLIVGMSKKNIEQFVEEMASWIHNVAKSLTTNQRISQLYNNQKVSLWCPGSNVKFNGTVAMMSLRPEDAEKESRDRFRRAIEEKLPKLITYKEKGFTTALLLEDVSFSHSNLGDNLKDLIPHQYLSEFQSKIDYVVILVSQKEKMFLGRVWKKDSQLYSEIPENRRF